MATRRPLVVVVGQTVALPAGDVLSASVSNVIASPTTIPTDSTYTVAGYLRLDSDLTIDGNLLITG